MRKIESKNPGRLNIVLTGTDKVHARKLGDLIQELKTVLSAKGISSADAFFGIHEISSEMELFKLHFMNRFSLFGVATGLYIATAVLDEFPVSRDSDGNYRASRQNAEIIIQESEAVFEDGYIDSLTGNVAQERQDSTLLNVAQMLCESIIHQADIVFKVANALIITGNAAFGNLPRESERSDGLFESCLGVNSYEYLFYTFAIWVVSQKNGIVDSTNILAQSVDKASQLPKLMAVLEELSKKTTEINYPQPTFDYSGKALPLAFFSRHPIIRIDNHLFLVSNANFMQLQFTNKYLTKALLFARKSEGKVSSEYSQYLGKVRFEGFFKELCNIWNPSGGHFDEYYYDNRNKNRSSDRIAFEQHGSRSICHLFQIKLKMLRESTHFGISMPNLEEDIRPFSEMISASINFLGSLEDAQKKNRLRPEGIELSCRILASDKFCFIGISPDLPPIFALKSFRDKVLEEAQANLSNNGKQWFNSNRRRIHWHIIDITEFQVLLTLHASDKRLFKHLSDYLRMSEIDKHLLDRQGTLPTSFGSYLNARFSTRSQRPSADRFKNGLSEIKNIFDDFQKEMGRYFFATDEGHYNTLDEIT